MDSTVRVAVALSDKKAGFTDGEGASPMILAFNENGEHIGHSFWGQKGHIGSGSFKDITIHQDAGPGQQATHLQILAQDDAICIAYISQTWADGAARGWLGDMGQACNQQWYYSNVIVGDEGHKPFCTWIDQNHSNDILNAAMQIHMEDFVQLSETHRVEQDPEFYCRLPAMLFKRYHNYNFNKMYQPWESPGHEPGLTDYANTRLGIYNSAPNLQPWEYTLWNGQDFFDYKPKDSKRSRRQAKNDTSFEHLITSPHEKHNAQALCESDTSHGPDFVSLHEKIFCDMSTKMAWPLCMKEEEVNCFHLEQEKMVFAKRDVEAEALTGSVSERKSYSHVVEWD